MKQIKNMVVKDNRCMTSLDDKLDRAIETARQHGLPYNHIVPKRIKGRIAGYYVINAGGETALATIE